MDVNADTNIGKEVGGAYRIISRISCGGYGCVYKAQHIIFEDEPIVAIKLMRTPFASDEERKQSLKEARLLKELKHKHILPIIQAGIEHDILYIVMKYAEGGSLKDRLKQLNGQPLPQEEAITILKQIGSALSFAHQKQKHVVHCDLKPDNILFNAQGEVLLADFGMATIIYSKSHGEGKGGTPAYMPPEQFRGYIRRRSDQYALGCIAYEMFTGHRMFEEEGANLGVIQYQFLHSKVMPTPPKQHNPNLSDAVSQAILTALAKEYSDRFADIPSFLTALSSQKTARQWFNEGYTLADSQRYLEAVTAYDEAIKLQPNEGTFYINKGFALRNLRKYEEALKTYNEAIRQDPNNAQAYNNKGTVLALLQRHAEAVAAFDKAIHLEPKEATAYYNKGLALYAQNKFVEAIAAFDVAIKYKSNYPEAYYNKGNALFNVQRYDEAVKAYETTIKLKSDYIAAYVNKSYAFDQLGRKQEAQQAYEQAKQLGFKG